MSALEILRQANQILVSPRAVFSDLDGNERDWTEFVASGSLTRDCEAGAAADITFQVPRGVPLPRWSRDTLSLSLEVRDPEHGLSEVLHLGKYTAETPSWPAGTSVRNIRVKCYDIISAIDTPYGHSVTAARGETVRAGISRLVLDEALWADFSVMLQSPELDDVRLEDSVWPVGSETTYRTVLDDLLTWAGWRPGWSDRHGHITSTSWVNLYDDDIYSYLLEPSVVSPGPVRKEDDYGIPNEGTFINWSLGKVLKRELLAPEHLSVAGRGRPVHIVTEIDTLTEQAFEAAADRAWSEMTSAPVALCFEMPPVPIWWHRDGFQYANDELDFPPGSKFLVRNWRLPLTGTGNMRVVANYVPLLSA
ncbi:MAG: hypothetical protein F4237_12490 [Gemmatimonadetes bacterium]|nr:hypothetical protein [Gemmatimonadota bacterium]